MTSSRPYIIRAIYEWIVDNGLTPYILVDARDEGVVVPEGYIENNRIILNISPSATNGLALGNDSVSFNARFGGSPMEIFIPTPNVLAIYAQENGQGMMFGDSDGQQNKQDDGGSDDHPPDSPSPGGGGKKPSLTVVK